MVKHYHLQWSMVVILKTSLFFSFTLSFSFSLSLLSLSSQDLHFLPQFIPCTYWVYMAQHSHVPKFGNWEGEEHVPYSDYFDKARKSRTGSKIINPNDPEENPDLVYDKSSSTNLPPTNNTMADSKDLARKESDRSTHELQKSKEDSDPKPFTNSPARHDNVSNRSDNDSTYRRGGHNLGSAANHQKPARQSTGSEHSIERSPLHRQAKNPGTDSPSWEGKNSSHNSHSTPGRSRLNPVNRGNESPDGGPAVPKFGEWDETDPASADGFTHIFNKVREQRQGAGQATGTPTRRSYDSHSQATNDKAQSCCFGWCK